MCCEFSCLKMAMALVEIDFSELNEIQSTHADRHPPEPVLIDWPLLLYHVMEEAAGLAGSPFSDLPTVRYRLELLGAESPAVDADLAIAVSHIDLELSVTPPDQQLPYPVPASAEQLAPLAVEEASTPEPGDTLLPHPTPVPADALSITEQCEGKICKVKNDLTVAVEVRLNEGGKWHVLYPEQTKEALFDPEVSVRLREDYHIQSKIRIEEVSGILNIPRSFEIPFQDKAQKFIHNQWEEAEKERRKSDERRNALTNKLNQAIKQSTHRRQACLFLCTAIILSVLLGSLVVGTVVSFGLDYYASEQFGLFFALVLLWYCSTAALGGFLGTPVGIDSSVAEYKYGNSEKYFSEFLQDRAHSSLGSKLQGYVAQGQWSDEHVSCRAAVMMCCCGCTLLIPVICIAVFCFGIGFRAVEVEVEAGKGKRWFIGLLIFAVILILLGALGCATFRAYRHHICWTVLITAASTMVFFVALAGTGLRAVEAGNKEPWLIVFVILGATMLAVLSCALYLYRWSFEFYTFAGSVESLLRQALGKMHQLHFNLVASCCGLTLEDLLASLVPRSALDAAVLEVHQRTIVFEGNVLPNKPTIVSWPGKYESKWNDLVVNARQKEVSAAVVFLPEGSKHFGVHDRIPRKYVDTYDLRPPPKCCQCWCHWLYGEQKPWGCRWWTRWIHNVELAVKNKKYLQVYFFDGKKEQGKVGSFKTAGDKHKRWEKIFKQKNKEFRTSVKYGQALVDGLGLLSSQNGPDSSSPFSREVHRLFLDWLSDEDRDEDRQFLEASEGLGNSQKAEVAWLDMLEYPYKELEVAEFRANPDSPDASPIGRPDSERQLLPAHRSRSALTE